MQYVFLFFIFATFFMMESHGYVGYEMIPLNNAHPGKCFVERHRMVLEFEKAYPVPRKCERMVCKRAGSGETAHMLSIAGCGYIAVQPPCKLSEVNLRKVYPNCCPKPIC